MANMKIWKLILFVVLSLAVITRVPQIKQFTGRVF